MEINLVTEGLKFMVLGMGTVLAFLVIMIAFMMLQARIINRCFPEPKASEPTTAAAPQQKQSKTNKIAAIAAAIMHYNKTK